MDEEQHLPFNHGEQSLPIENIEQDSSIQSTESKPETTDMEVHHLPDLHHKPKPWKEYLLEGLMIFIAVTLGFFAEQLREQFVENHREREYAQSLYNDLKVDTDILQRTIDEKKWIIAKFDSTEKLLASNDIINNNEFIYYVERYVTFKDVFTSQDVTYQQLKSSGNFRYMKNIVLYKRIADYYNLYSRYQELDGRFGLEGKNDISELESKVFNPKDLTSLDNENPANFYNLAIRPVGKKFAPITTNKDYLSHLYIKIANSKSRSLLSNVLLIVLKPMAKEIMNELKTEYQLD